MMLGSIAAFSPIMLASAMKVSGVLILDNCDAHYDGKAEFHDNLTLLDGAGNRLFQISGFNNCESIGSSHMIATDVICRHIWVIENVGRRIRRFDYAGRQTLEVPDIRGSALAIDPETGNVWALTGDAIGKHSLVIYDGTGAKLAAYPVSGWDIVYDRNAKAFWIAERKLTKISAVDRRVEFAIDIATWCASSVDIDQQTGEIWVAVREHSQVAGSRNRLLKFDAADDEKVAIDLGSKGPFRVSVNPKDHSVWVANFRKSVEQFSADGRSRAEYPVAALAVQADAVDGSVWLVTATDVQQVLQTGVVTKRANHPSATSQAWMSVLE
jgi:hypothetical protein